MGSRRTVAIQQRTNAADDGREHDVESGCQVAAGRCNQLGDGEGGKAAENGDGKVVGHRKPGGQHVGGQ